MSKTKDMDYIEKLKAALRSLKEISCDDYFDFARAAKDGEEAVNDGESVKINSKKLDNQNTK